MSFSSFRPIAPAAHMDVYAASCNPPRRAKRLRSDSNPEEPDMSPVSSLSSPPPHLEDDSYDHPQAPAPKRRGRKPGTMSRAAREAQRKINHSLIEKARRTKINDALAALRELVPPEYKRPFDANAMVEDSDDEERDPKKPKTKPKNSGEKEFKLEILVRTVTYLQDLTEKVKELEDKGCPHCSEPISLSGECGRSKNGQRESIPDVRPHATSSQDPLTSRCSSVAPTSRLPSISAWLPSSAEEQQSLLLTPSQSPAFDPVVSTRSAIQLPTPPSSANCAPSTNGYAIPPVLTLPSPSTFLPPTGNHMQPRFSGFTPRASTKTSPLASPVYTPEDETAASLLLRISSSTSPQTSFKKAVPLRLGEVESKYDVNPGMGSGYALTPSRLLGLTSAER